MNKAELVEEVANQTGLTKKTSREAVDAVISAMTDCLAREENHGQK
jgi:nucleoid DNA-binding protein